MLRTVRDIQVLEQCEVHPIRTEFAELLGEGAFGKVHKARLKDGLDFFKSNEEFVHNTWRQKIVAVKELHGEYDSFYDIYLSYQLNMTIMKRIFNIKNSSYFER